jgi:hypothetical protein
VNVLNIASGDTDNINVKYENGTPVGSLVSGVWTIPNPIVCDPINTLTLNSGAISNLSGDDGDISFGRLVDFFTLTSNNHFGHTQRFTSLNGGYFDGTDYRDVNGNISTEGAVWAVEITLDWAQRTDTQVLAYSRTFYSALDATDMLATQPFTIGAYNTFNVCNLNSLMNIRFNGAIPTSNIFNYGAIKAEIGNQAVQRIRTSTSSGTNYLAFISDGTIRRLAPANELRHMYFTPILISSL